MALKPKPNDKKQITTFRILSILSLFYSLFVLITEATVIYDPQYTLMYLIVENHPDWKYRNWLFTIVFLISLVLVCFFTIFNSKLSDFLQLVPKHTDCLQLSSVVSYCCKIIVSFIVFDMYRLSPALTTWLSWEKRPRGWRSTNSARNM